mmetsp:Transcript_2306/g.5458  ORF Transcript_2306/g.5458 Transcript_2306/m.5458 type:complete len:308 (+) Transcript_2306:127-1050(+)
MFLVHVAAVLAERPAQRAKAAGPNSALAHLGQARAPDGPNAEGLESGSIHGPEAPKGQANTASGSETGVPGWQRSQSIKRPGLLEAVVPYGCQVGREEAAHPVQAVRRSHQADVLIGRRGIGEHRRLPNAMAQPQAAGWWELLVAEDAELAEVVKGEIVHRHHRVIVGVANAGRRHRVLELAGGGSHANVWQSRLRVLPSEGPKRRRSLRMCLCCIRHLHRLQAHIQAGPKALLLLLLLLECLALLHWPWSRRRRLRRPRCACNLGALSRDLVPLQAGGHGEGGPSRSRFRALGVGGMLSQLPRRPR